MQNGRRHSCSGKGLVVVSVVCFIYCRKGGLDVREPLDVLFDGPIFFFWAGGGG